jgi:hypothetical protein
LDDEMTSPKERYDARMKLKRAAKDPDWKTDEQVTQDYVFDLVDRFVVAVEAIAKSMETKTNDQ